MSADVSGSFNACPALTIGGHMSRTRRVQSLRRSGGFFLALLAGIIALAFAAGGALAQEYGPSTSQGALNVSPDAVRPGQSTTVSGSGMAANAPVTVSLGSTTLGTTTADSAGRFSLQVTIPANQAPGRYTLSARGAAPDGGTRVLTAQITVLDPSGGSPSGGPSGGGTLSRTGSSSTIPLTVLAVTLVLVGAAIVALLRRRHLQRPI